MAKAAVLLLVTAALAVTSLTDRVGLLEAQARMTSMRLAKLEAQNVDLESRVEYLQHQK